MTIVLASPSAAPKMSDYLVATRRLLHDASGQFYSDNELQDYINEARVRIVRDTGCYRKLQSIALTAGKEIYTFSTDFPLGLDTIDVMGLSVIWGQTRIACSYLAWGEFQVRVRAWTNQLGQPSVFSTYGQTSMYVGYVPDQTYTAEADTVVAPPNLVPLTGGGSTNAIGVGSASITSEIIPIPFTSPVPFFAAHLAKFKEQSWADSDSYLKKYTEEAQRALGSSFTRRVRNPYS